jgi:hypothetical protein
VDKVIRKFLKIYVYQRHGFRGEPRLRDVDSILCGGGLRTITKKAQTPDSDTQAAEEVRRRGVKGQDCH